MNEKIQAVLQKIGADPELIAKLRACQTPDEAYVLIGGTEAGFTKEEFIACMEEVKASVEGLGEMTEEDLRKIAGGDNDWLITAGISAVSSATSAAAASAAI